MAETRERGDKPMKCPCCRSGRELLFLCGAGKNGEYPQYQCRRCGFEFSWPCPTGAELDRFYASGEYYSQPAGDDDPEKYSDYDRQIEYTLVFFRDLLKGFALPAGCALLDVGCALGRFMELARNEFGFECAGVELSDYARNYVKEHYRGAFPVWRSLDEMPSPAKPFDVILLFDVLEHVNDPWQLLLGLFRRGCVGENTRLLITTPNCAFRDARKDPAKWQYRYPPAHLSFCSPETFRKIGEALLFRHIDISGHTLAAGGFPEMREMMRKPYDGYQGLICRFSGSALGNICDENFPASPEELKSSGKYLDMLADYIFEHGGEPCNPRFRSDLAEFCDGLVARGEADRKRYDELTGRYAELEKTYSDALAANDALAAELESVNRNRYAMWLEAIARVDRVDRLEGEVRELDADKARLEGEVRELDARRDRLEGKVRELEAYRDHLEKQVRELDLERIRLDTRGRELEADKARLEGKVRELDACRIVLEKQLREFEANRLRLEGRIRELEAYRDHLEKQVREIDAVRVRLEGGIRELEAYRDQLEDQVRDLAAELDRVYRSHSYRIGRAVTWPVRKCKAAAAWLRKAWRRCRQVAKECGAAFMWKCVFRKLTGQRLYRTYDVVTSLGFNCEVAFHLDRINGFVDSYPLVWAFVHSPGGLPELIADPLSLAGEHEMKHDHSCNMVRCTDVDISFHCKGMPSSLLGADGKVDEIRAQAERDELKSRLAYLAKKWKELLTDPDRTVVSILTPGDELGTTEEIVAVYEALRKYPGTDLVVVLTGREKRIDAAELRAAGIYVRYITHHPPHDHVTDAERSDLKGWNRIGYEFRPRKRKKSDKVYKYEQKTS